MVDNNLKEKLKDIDIEELLKIMQKLDIENNVFNRTIKTAEEELKRQEQKPKSKSR